MDVTPLIPEGRQVIEAYGDGGFRITGARHQGPVLVFPEETLSWTVDSFDKLDLASLEPIMRRLPPLEILLIGCGRRMEFVHPELRARVRAAGPVIDVMDTGAACRTYNVLMSEARRVAAALIPVG